jgi:hypothetical protein
MDQRCQAIEASYNRLVEQFAAAEDFYARRERLVMNLRVATFFIAVALFVVGWNSKNSRPWYIAGGLVICGFPVAVAYHEHVRQQLLRNGILRQINQEAIARLHRRWPGVPRTSVAVPPQHRALADDLDLFGHASLFHFLNQAGTPIGIRQLRDWLLTPATPDEIRRRQQAAIKMAPHLDMRQKLILEGRLLSDRGEAIQRFIDWAEGPPWLAARPWLAWLCRGLAVSFLLAIIMGCAGVLPAEPCGLLLFGLLCANMLVIGTFGGKVHDIFAPLNLRRGEATRFLRLFELLYAIPESSDELDAIKREATQLGGGALLRMRQLRRIAALATMSKEPLFTIFVYLPLQIFFLYDFHVLGLLESFQRKYGVCVRRWFEALGKFEALCSLAAVVHDHPHWTMPDVDAAADRLQADQIGHPLLPMETCVPNDVEIGPAGSFLLVTGSNMSGKSTLLRAVGLNAILAQAGAPVCAASLSMPPLTLATSIRVRDCLEIGVSFYMAELMRLKEIVELARNTDSQAGRTLLYLLDEILLGTNSKERHIAVIRVLQHLLHRRAIGAISTHDLDLATSEPLSSACRCVHFCETLHDRDAERPMTFDYKLRPGVATTSNALKLLEIVGLGQDSEPSRGE